VRLRRGKKFRIDPGSRVVGIAVVKVREQIEPVQPLVHRHPADGLNSLVTELGPQAVDSLVLLVALDPAVSNVTFDGVAELLDGTVIGLPVSKQLREPLNDGVA